MPTTPPDANNWVFGDLDSSDPEDAPIIRLRASLEKLFGEAEAKKMVAGFDLRNPVNRELISIRATARREAAAYAASPEGYMHKKLSEAGRKGAKARMESLDTIRRSQIARRAATTRWRQQFEYGLRFTSVDITDSEHGKKSTYWIGRIQRERPDIYERMKKGDFYSVRQAALAAGLPYPGSKPKGSEPDKPKRKAARKKPARKPAAKQEQARGKGKGKKKA